MPKSRTEEPESMHCPVCSDGKCTDKHIWRIFNSSRAEVAILLSEPNRVLTESEFTLAQYVGMLPKAWDYGTFKCTWYEEPKSKAYLGGWKGYIMTDSETGIHIDDKGVEWRRGFGIPLVMLHPGALSLGNKFAIAYFFGDLSRLNKLVGSERPDRPGRKKVKKT